MGYISSITPKTASIGDTVVLEGSGFSLSGNTLTVDSVSATISVETSASITFVVPTVTIDTVDIIVTTALSADIYAPNGLTVVEPSIGYEEVTPMPNSFFHFQANPAYDSDKELYRNLLAEGFNIYGTPMTYYVVSYDTSYDLLFGEDNNRRVARKFPVNAVFDLPKEEDAFAKFGLENLDTFEMHVSKKHFTSASMYDTSGVSLFPPETDPTETEAYPSIVPKVGDMIKSDYNNVFYEVTSIHEEEEMFLQTKHAWRFMVRVFRDDKLTLSADTSAVFTELSAVSNIEDILEINDYITSANEDVKYTCAVGEENSNQPDIQDGWF